MSHSDLRPGAARLQQEAILDSMAARSAVRCLDCNATTRTALDADGHLIRRCEALNARGISAGCGWFVAIPDEEAAARQELALIAARVVTRELGR